MEVTHIEKVLTVVVAIVAVLFLLTVLSGRVPSWVPFPLGVCPRIPFRSAEFS